MVNIKVLYVLFIHYQTFFLMKKPVFRCFSPVLDDKRKKNHVPNRGQVWGSASQSLSNYHNLNLPGTEPIPSSPYKNFTLVGQYRVFWGSKIKLGVSRKSPQGNIPKKLHRQLSSCGHYKLATSILIELSLYLLVALKNVQLHTRE